MIPVRAPRAGRFVGMVVQFSRSASEDAPSGTRRGVSQNSTAWPHDERATQARSTLGNRLELDAREMRAWLEAGAPVLELP